MKFPGAFAAQSAPLRQEVVTITLAPKEGMEYKYRLERNAALLFSWTATAALHFELHSEQDGAPRGTAEFFDRHDEAAAARGVYNAPFPGIHGWYWENRTDREVTITLTTAGFYSESREFRRGMPIKVKPFD
jgi:hypothetical protein